MNIYSIIAIAEQNVSNNKTMRKSAESCLRDAKLLVDINEIGAKERALKSLAYSAGTLSPIYQKAKV